MLFSWLAKRSARARDICGAHVAVFLMNHAGAIAAMRPLLDTLRDAGCRVTLINYSCATPLPFDELRASGVAYLTLSDLGMESIPRLTRDEYREQCGDDLDFPRVYFNESLCAGLSTERNWLFADSFHHQRYYGTAWRIEQLLESLAPDYAIVHQGSEPVSKICYAKCRKRGLPTLLWETPFFPGKVLLDSRGMHFFWRENKIEHDWPQVAATPLKNAEQRRIDDFLTDWRARGVSKYPQTTDEAEWQHMQAALAPGKKTLFLAGQVPWDANILNGLHVFDGLVNLLRYVRGNLPDDWQVVYKPHPMTPDALAEFDSPGPNFHVVRQASIHRLLQMADAVLVHSSNVGLEALAYDKPVVVCGRPYYSGRGLTLDLADRGDLAPLLAQAASFRPDAKLRDRLLHYVAFSYLIDEGDTAALQARLRDAAAVAAAAGPMTGRLAPFSGQMPVPALWYVGLQESYNALAGQNLVHQEILERLAKTTSQLPWGVPQQPQETVGADERPAGVRMADIPPDNTQQYLLAAELVAPGARVLDFGCGTGYGSYLIAHEADAQVTGVDALDVAVRYAQNHWSDERVEYVCASAGSYSPAAGSFDAIVALGVLEHMPDDRRLIAQLWRALAPGGRLIVSAPLAVADPLHAHPQRVRHYTPRGLEQLTGELAGVAAQYTLAQNGPVGRPTIRPGADGRRLLLVLEKTSHRAACNLPKSLADLLPFEKLPPHEMTSPRHRFAAAEMSPGAAMPDELGGLFYGGRSHGGDEPVCLAQGPAISLAAGTYELLIELACHRDAGERSIAIRLTADGQPSGDAVYTGDAIHKTPQGLVVRWRLAAAATNFVPAVWCGAEGPLRIMGWRITRLPDAPESRAAA